MERAGRIRIVSGGQSGVDRGALDAALELGLPCGGWCPAGRRAEDGTIPERYPLRESPSSGYEQRTEWNVLDSDATLVLNRGGLSGGTLYTIQIAERAGRPLKVLELEQMDASGDREEALSEVLDWLIDGGVSVLNVAGPRESKAPGIQRQSRGLLVRLFLAWMGAGSPPG